MKNFLAIIGCFCLAIIMITVFASCGNKNNVTIEDPEDSITEQATDTAEKDDSEAADNTDKTESDSAVDEQTAADEQTGEEATTKSAGSEFLDTVLDGVGSIVGEALGGAANVVEEALSGAAEKVNSAFNEENKD